MVGQLINGPWLGASIPMDLVAGRDFNCTATICYGITKAGEAKPGSVHALFVALQTEVNRYATGGGKARAGFAPLVVDGFLGDKTVAAVAAVDAYLRRQGVASGIPADAIANRSRTALAIKAPAVLEALRQVAQPGSQPPVVAIAPTVPPAQTPPTVPPAAPPTSSGGPGAAFTPSSPPASGGAMVPAGGTAQVPAPAPAPAEKSNTIWWILGAVGVIAIAGATTYVIVRRRRKPAMTTERAYA